MLNGESVLVVIPARAGSKRCPGKNKRIFRGKPLYEWTLMCALQWPTADHIVFSTDDESLLGKIAALCTKNSRLVVSGRPEHLATDSASAEDVLRHELSLAYHDWTVLLQPTSPLRHVSDIDNCFLIAVEAQTCVSYRPDMTKNGAVYVARSKWLLEGHNFSEETLKYIMPSCRSLDIDYPEQFQE